jgi:hypothetical protein
MTLTELLADTYRRLNFQTTPDTAVTTRLTAFINETHAEILAKPGLQSLLYGSLAFASVASQARYGLPLSVARILSVTETTNRRKLETRSLDWYRTIEANPASNTGTPEVYIPLGQQAVKRVPATTGTGLWVASSSASDTVPTVAIEAIRVDGYPHTPANATLTGVTRVAIGGGSALTDYIDVTQFMVSAACVGDVTLYDAAAAGNVLGVIPRGATSARYQCFALFPTPSAALPYTIDVEHDAYTLSAANDEPLLPLRFHRLLAIGARVKEYEKEGNERYAIAKLEFDDAVDDMIYNVTCSPDYVMVPGQMPSSGSNLGPMYPNGRW